MSSICSTFNEQSYCLDCMQAKSPHKRRFCLYLFRSIAQAITKHGLPTMEDSNNNYDIEFSETTIRSSQFQTTDIEVLADAGLASIQQHIHPATKVRQRLKPQPSFRVTHGAQQAAAPARPPRRDRGHGGSPDRRPDALHSRPGPAPSRHPQPQHLDGAPSTAH